MNNLELLFEEERQIVKKVSEALAALRAWFEKKLDQAANIFAEIKDKVVEKLKGVERPVAKKDIVVDGKVVCKKGQSINSHVQANLEKVKKGCKSAVDTCKAGIKDVEKKDVKGANDKKGTVVKTLGVVAGSVAVIGSIIVGAVGIDAYNTGKKAYKANNGVLSAAMDEIDDKYSDETRIAKKITKDTKKAQAKRAKLESYELDLLFEEDLDVLFEEIEGVKELKEETLINTIFELIEEI